MQFKITVFLSLAIILGLLWWSSSQYDKGYQAGRDHETARCQTHINEQAAALQSAMHQAREASRKQLQVVKQENAAQRDKLNHRIQTLLTTNERYKQYYETTAPAGVLDSIYGVQ